MNRFSILLGIFVFANITTTIKIATDSKFFNSSDFIAYSIGAKMVLDGQGKNLYDLKLQTDYWDDFLADYGGKRETPYILPYLAPPTTALLYIPYLHLPTDMKVPVAMGVSITMVLLGTIILGKTTNNLKLALLIVFSSWFVFVCVWQIQPTAYLFLATTLLYWALKKEKFGLAGVLCAVFILKPQYLIIAPLVFVLTNKSWTFVKAFLITLLILAGMNLLISGPQTLFIDYPRFLAFTNNPNYGNRWYEMYSVQQITYLFSRLIPIDNILPIVTGTLFYIWGLLKIRNLTTKKATLGLFAPLLVLTVVCAYHVLPQDMSMVVVANYLVILALNKCESVKLMLITVTAHLLGNVTVASPLAPYYALIFYVVPLTMLLINKTNQKPLAKTTKDCRPKRRFLSYSKVLYHIDVQTPPHAGR